MREDGVIFFTGRCKRMIISSGFNVYPNMIEEVIEKQEEEKEFQRTSRLMLSLKRLLYGK